MAVTSASESGEFYGEGQYGKGVSGSVRSGRCGGAVGCGRKGAGNWELGIGGLCSLYPQGREGVKAWLSELDEPTDKGRIGTSIDGASKALQGHGPP